MSLQPNEPNDDKSKPIPSIDRPPITPSENTANGGFWKGFFLGIIFTLMVGFGVCMMLIS